MTTRYWRKLGWVGVLAGLAGGVALAVIPPGDNNEPNCPPCQHWNGTECVPRSLVAWPELQEDSGRIVYKALSEATPAEGAITYSVVPRNGVLGGGVELDGTVTPDPGASVVSLLVTLSMGSSTCVSFPVDVPVGECDSCGDCSPGEASASLDSGRMQYSVKTGGAAFGKGPALRLSPPALDATAGQPTPRNLSILRKPGTEVIPDAVTKGVRQVLTAQALVDEAVARTDARSAVMRP